MTSVLPVEPTLIYTRKRTTSFSAPSPSSSRPRKAARTTMGLQRSQSYVSLPTLPTSVETAPPCATARDDAAIIRTLQFFKERREKRQAAAASLSSSNAKPLAISLVEPVRVTRLSSPLSPSPHPISFSPCCPIPRKRSRNVEPDLYRIAITTAMKGSPEGQQILKFGARGAMMAATFELDVMVTRGRRSTKDVNGDVYMGNEASSWVFI